MLFRSHISLNGSYGSLDVGELNKNIELSRKRAQAVVDRLIKNYGIEQSRISAQGIGFLSPKSNNSTEKSRKKNRRVEAILIMR